MFPAQDLSTAVKSVINGFRPVANSISLNVSDTTDIDVLITYALSARSLDEASAALERILQLEPGNEIANAGFTWLLGVRDSAEQIESSASTDIVREDELSEDQHNVEAVAETADKPLKAEVFSTELFDDDGPTVETEEFIYGDQRSNQDINSNENSVEFFEDLPLTASKEAEQEETERAEAEAAAKADQEEIERAEAAAKAEQEEQERAEASANNEPESAIAADAEKLADEVRAATVAPSSDTGASDRVRDEKLTILTVDDSPTIRKLLMLTLEREGFNVVQAEDGVEALVKMSECNPAMILSDINMPRLDGYKLCKFVKKHAKTRHIPVIMLSGKDGVFDKLRGKMSGCDGYLTKPFESRDLLEKIHSFIGTPA